MTKSPHPRAVAVSLIVHLPTSPSAPPSFLLVSSRKHGNRWVQPKGGIEKGETAREAAQREAWEEAGLPISSSTHLAHLSLVPSTKPHPASPSPTPSDPSFLPHSTYSFELFSVPSEDVLSAHWPEEHERTRQWVDGWDALKAAVAWGDRGELMLAAAELARAKLAAP